MKIYSIKAEKREKTGKRGKCLREQALVPGVIYGPDVKENLLIQLPINDLTKLYDEAGESNLISLEIPGNKEPLETLIKDVSYDPLLARINHVDFYKVKAGHKIDTAIELDFINDAPAIKEFGGTLVVSLNELRVRCLPKDLSGNISVDLSPLKTFEDSIQVKDLNLPPGMELLVEPTETVAQVMPVSVEKEQAPAAEVKMPEVQGKEGKDEAAEPADAKNDKKAAPEKK